MRWRMSRNGLRRERPYPVVCQLGPNWANVSMVCLGSKLADAPPYRKWVGSLLTQWTNCTNYVSALGEVPMKSTLSSVIDC